MLYREIPLNVFKVIAALVLTVIVFTVFRVTDSRFTLSSRSERGAYEVMMPAEKHETADEPALQESAEESEDIPVLVEVMMTDISADIPFETGAVQIPSVDVSREFSPVKLPQVKPASSSGAAKGSEGIYELKDVDVKPSVMSRRAPVYPPFALKSQIEGKVYVRLKLSISGSVIEAEMLKSDPPGVFDTAALDAVREWRFTPAYKNDRKVNVWGVIVPISFTLQR